MRRLINQEQVEEVIKDGNCDCIVHCALWTAVDKGEDPELFEKVREVNALGTKYRSILSYYSLCRKSACLTQIHLNIEDLKKWNKITGS